MRSKSPWIAASFALTAVFGMASPAGAQAQPTHAIAMHGQPRHPPSMTAFPYVDPSAPKGGRVVLGVYGSFDSLNPLIFKGAVASGVRELVYESLMARSADEPFSLYGLLAATVDVPPDRSRADFTLRPEARFSDGRPVTPADVIFSVELLREKGWPFMRSYYSRVASVSEMQGGRIRFAFKPGPDGSFDRELPLIIGLMPIVPRHAVDPAAFESTTLTPPTGSGPYVVERVEVGRSVTFRRNPSWWAKDLAVTRGRHNFDEIRYDYYREETALFEAFKAGSIDIFVDDDAGRWSTGYDLPALRDGRLVKLEIEQRTPAGMAALVFNSRREPFEDIRVRRALIRLFDAELVNRNIYGGLARRTHSFFERSDLSSFANAAGDGERALLSRYPDAVKPEIMDGTARLPVSPGNGNNRANQEQALKELAAAGYAMSGTRLLHTATGRQLAFEILVQTRAEERLLLNFTRSLAALGIQVSLRRVDSAQYEARLKDGQYDMIRTVWGASLSPGNEQHNRWGSKAAEQPNTRNYAGIRSPAVDAMIDALLAARGATEFQDAARALDRVLRSGDYVIPLFHLPRLWLAHWTHVQPPVADGRTNAGFDLDTWHVKRPQ